MCLIVAACPALPAPRISASVGGATRSGPYRSIERQGTGQITACGERGAIAPHSPAPLPASHRIPRRARPWSSQATPSQWPACPACSHCKLAGSGHARRYAHQGAVSSPARRAPNRPTRQRERGAVHLPAAAFPGSPGQFLTTLPAASSWPLRNALSRAVVPEGLAAHGRGHLWPAVGAGF